MPYNPQNLYECERERKVRKGGAKEAGVRNAVDTTMVAVGLLASISSVPQVWKIFQSGDVSGISLLTQLLGLFAVIAWFSYGLYIRNKPLVITTSVTTAVLVVVVVQILIYQ